MRKRLIKQARNVRKTFCANVDTLRSLFKNSKSLTDLVFSLKKTAGNEDIIKNLEDTVGDLNDSIGLFILQTDDLFDETDEFFDEVFSA